MAQSPVPGTNRFRPTPTNKENPFSQPSASKTKAQLKNEKRRERKREELGAEVGERKAWDESDEEGTRGDLLGKFKKAEDRDGREEKKEKDQGGEEEFPSLTHGASRGHAASSIDPAESVPESSTQVEVQKTRTSSAIITTLTPLPVPSPPLNDLEAQLDSTEQTWRTKRPPSANPAPKANNLSGRSSPLHPVQEGRNGPIGIANPPHQPGSEAVPVQEPRTRKEVRVREGVANDMGSLATRMKNLVIDNQQGVSSSGRKG